MNDICTNAQVFCKSSYASFFVSPLKLKNKINVRYLGLLRAPLKIMIYSLNSRKLQKRKEIAFKLTYSRIKKTLKNTGKTPWFKPQQQRRPIQQSVVFAKMQNVTRMPHKLLTPSI